ncbi:hypothetical protein AB0F49_30740 [Micromonospora ureilytica]|uniref:hypothetical protein n=1 Tax=Micromonospora ureilytica TaxID=709868 RepID=UPI0033CD6F86
MVTRARTEDNPLAAALVAVQAVPAPALAHWNGTGQQLGGKLDGVTYSEEHGVPLLDNGQYTLFLETYSDQPASLLNPVQAQYPVDAGNGLLSLPGNEITTSVTQLDRLAHK